MASCICQAFDPLFTYSKHKTLKIHSVKLGICHLLGLLGVFAFIFIYLIWYGRGYQKTSSIESAVVTTVFGVADTNTSDHTIWDKADYMVPAQENGAFTITTSILFTPNQRLGYCGEDPHVGNCSDNNDCQRSHVLPHGNGIMTGKCIESKIKPGVNVCEIHAWCPVLHDDPSKRKYLATENFTVFIRADVTFPEFGQTRDNIPIGFDLADYRSCNYDENKNCPIFRIGSIAERTGSTFASMVQWGGVIEIVVKWDCEFPDNLECLPTYEFNRLDRPEDPYIGGFHMRYSDHFRDQNNKDVRTSYTAFGIRCIVTVSGVGRKTDFETLVKTVGSGLSYLGIVPVFIGLILCFYKKKAKGKDRSDGVCCYELKEQNRRSHEKGMDNLEEQHFFLADALQLCCIKYFDNTSGGNRSDENGTGGNRSDESGTGGNRSDENGTGGNRSDENGTGRNRTGENRSGENGNGGNRTGGNRSDKNRLV